MKQQQTTIPDLFFKKEERKKKLVLAISDIPLATTGVAVQFNQLLTYMLGTDEYMFYVIGGAMQHPDMDIKVINDSFVIEPCIGQGNKELVRKRLQDLQPDAIFIFTDPHQYMYLWEMSDEVRQLCPILYWHVWDNDPYPDCNTNWYNDTDYIAAISRLTYNLVSSKFPEKTEYIPHTFSPYLYNPLPVEAKMRASEFFYKEKANWYKLLWVNRNGHRKQLNELLPSFKMFLEYLEQKEGHRNAVLLLRTEPSDQEGPNTHQNIERLNLQDNILLIEEKLDYSIMNVLYNSADLNLNVSKAEGFGLTLLTAMNTKTLSAGVLTGGIIDQIIDEETGEEYAIPIKVHHRNLLGSQVVPYIYEDYASREDIKDAMVRGYEMKDEERQDILERAYRRATTFFGHQEIMTKWKNAFDNEIAKFKENKLGKNQWTIQQVTIDERKEKAIANIQRQQMMQQQQQMMQQQDPAIQAAMNKMREQQTKNRGAV